MLEDKQLEEQLLGLHVEVLFNLSNDSRIESINEPDPEDPTPLVFLVRGKTKNMVWFRTDVPEALSTEISKIVATLPLWHGGHTDPSVFDELQSLIASTFSKIDVDYSLAFRFADSSQVSTESQVTKIEVSNSELLAKNFPYTKQMLEDRSPVFAVVENDHAVSACFSARSTDRAAEAGVATVEGFGSRGFAAAVTTAWAREIIRSKRIPLYSTSRENLASLSVARKLNLVNYAETVSFIEKDSDQS